MFSRRRRGSSANPPIDRNTSQNASAAATAAFLNLNNASNPSLSSAAAAAALRSQTSSPEPVGNLQTKRMIRRGSQSSVGSGMAIRGGMGRGSMERRNSNGSMTERTFRSSSRERGNGTMSPSLPPDAPPVPAIPTKIQKRASSVEPQQRVTSPAPQPGRRTVSVDIARRSPVVAPQPIQRLGDVAEAEDSSPTSPSRNFSRPMSPGAAPPFSAASKYTHKSGSWHTGAARPTTSDPVSSSKSIPPPINTTASVDDSVMVYDPSSRSFVSRSKSQLDQGSPASPTSPKAALVYDPNTRSLVQAPALQRTHSDTSATAVSAPVVKKTRPAALAVDTALEPPPRNPARLSPTGSSPRSPRAAGTLVKQPSTVREDPEAEQQAEAGSITVAKTPRPASTVSPPPSKVFTTPTAAHQRAVSLDVPRGSGSTARGRTVSSSPQRSARFSPSPVLQPERHVPPPRDLSPAKSALKHSPASSVRTTSPVAVFTPPLKAVGPPSETSEDTQSQDVFSGGKKKKSVRVSFDETPRAIDAAPVTPAPVPIFDEDDDSTMKPRPALPSFGSVRKNRVEPEVAQKVTEMPPERNEASSDHAIGGILRNSLEPLPPQVTSKEASGYASDESSDGEVPAVTSAATPEPAVVGAGQQYNNADQNLAPRVRDFASADQPSTTEESSEQNKDVPAIALQPPTPGVHDDAERQLGEQDEEFKKQPAIRNSMEHIVIPGSWSNETDSDVKDVPTESIGLQQEASMAPTVNVEAPTEESEGAKPVAADVPSSRTVPLELSDIDEDTSEGEFSDAMEDASDLEDNEGGFASMDAIVESPLVTASPADAVSKTATQVPPESPSEKQAARQADRAATASNAGSGDWNEATTYWAQLSKEKKQAMEKQHGFSDDEEPQPPKKAPIKSALKKTAPTPVANDVFTAAPQSSVSRTSSAASGPPALRKTMRGQPGHAPLPADDSVHLRSSMRSGGGATARGKQAPTQNRPQSEYVEPRGTLQKKNIRPMSLINAGTESWQSDDAPANMSSAYPSIAQKEAPTKRKADPPQVSARLQRELSNDSDSESSFKKKRRAGSADPSSRYAMRRSMRSGSIDSASAVQQSSRPTSPTPAQRNKAFSIRSLSPTGSLFGRKRMVETSKPAETTTRTTLRGPPASRGGARSTMRTSAGPKPVAAPPSKPKFRSRFVDSDNSDDDRSAPKTFRSRFADSDDSDDDVVPAALPSDLRPVRGIPRKQGQDDGDSTDLEDEDVPKAKRSSSARQKMSAPGVPDPSDVDKAMAAARRNLGMDDKPTPAENHEGEALRKGTLRDKPEDEKPSQSASPMATPLEAQKKRGFMGSLLRRNRHSSASVYQVRNSTLNDSPKVPPIPAPGTPLSNGVASPIAPASPSSPSTRKLTRRDSNQPKLKRGDSTFSTATAPPASAMRKNSDHWPLPPPVPPIPADDTAALAIDHDRPNTSDGVSADAIRLAQSMRPDLAPRSKSGHSLGQQQPPQQHRVTIQAGEEGTEPGERPPTREVYSLRTGKKKKFGALRRVLGIND